MRPSIETRLVESLDRSIANLEQLRPLLMLALARDDQPAERHDNDIVGKQIDRIAKNVFAVDKAASNTLRFAHLVSQPIDDAKERTASIPDCIVCSKLALPRPRRGLCGDCYEAYRWWSTKQEDPDIEIWKRTRKQDQDDTTDES